MSDILTTRDGLIGNSPRYLDAISPPYQRYLKDDTGNAVNLTGVPSGNLSIVFVNKSNPTDVFVGSGTFSIPSATASQGLISYQYGNTDLASGGNWYIFLTCQLIGELAPRVFDPDLLSIDGTSLTPSGGGTPVVTIQSVNLSEINGAVISASNPLPISIADGANVAQGTTTDASSANTQIGLLKAIKAFLAGTLAISGAVTASAGTNLNTSLLALESGGHLAAIDSHTPAQGQATMANSSPVVLASNQSAIPAAANPTSTATLSSVGGSASTVSLLASNANRKSFYVYNDSAANLYIAYAATASTTAFTVKVPPSTFYETPTNPVWQGAVSGIWDSATGNARVTEVA